MTEPNPSDEKASAEPSPSHPRHSAYPIPAIPADPPRRRWIWWALGFALLCVLAAWVLSLHGAMRRIEQSLAAPVQESLPLPERQQQILSFETRLARILGASVESKLRALERSVERGPLSPEELRLLESTANELRLLQANPAGVAGAVPELRDHPRYQATEASVGNPADADAERRLEDINELRKLYYASLICLSLFGMVSFGVWYHRRRRFRLLGLPLQHQLPVFKSYQEDRER